MTVYFIFDVIELSVLLIVSVKPVTMFLNVLEQGQQNMWIFIAFSQNTSLEYFSGKQVQRQNLTLS